MIGHPSPMGTSIHTYTHTIIILWLIGACVYNGKWNGSKGYAAHNHNFGHAMRGTLASLIDQAC